MGLTTTRFGIPYPVGTDLVRDGDDAMAAMAVKLDGLGLAFAMAGGIANISSAGSATSYNVAVTFPVGRFTQPPLVVCSVNIGTTNYVVTSSAATTTGCTLTIFHNTAGTNVGSGTWPIGWLAVQMLPGATNG